MIKISFFTFHAAPRRARLCEAWTMLLLLDSFFLIFFKKKYMNLQEILKDKTKMPISLTLKLVKEKIKPYYSNRLFQEDCLDNLGHNYDFHSLYEEEFTVFVDHLGLGYDYKPTLSIQSGLGFWALRYYFFKKFNLKVDLIEHGTSLIFNAL